MNQKQATYMREQLLDWYDENKRAMPWRATSYAQRDPYKTWLSEIMLQQTTVPAVVPYFLKFIKKWPSVEDLAQAEQDDVMNDWAGLGYYARARNLLKCAKVVANDYDGQFPDDYAALKALPGIGDYTASAIRAIAFDKPANVVDGNVERVMARLYAVKQPLPDSKPKLKALAAALAEGEHDRPGDYAQSLMDLGATICTPKSPKCLICPLRAFCDAYAQGVAEALPRKKKKKPQPQRYGYIYWILDESNTRLLLHKRPDKGLLAGMTGLPTSEWVSDMDEARHIEFLPETSLDVDKNKMIKHTFTHFDLTLYGGFAKLDKKSLSQDGYFWYDLKDLPSIGFPTVFKKFVNLMGHNK